MDDTKTKGAELTRPVGEEISGDQLCGRKENGVYEEELKEGEIWPQSPGEERRQDSIDKDGAGCQEKKKLLSARQGVVFS
jgi:hypothetical protein